jgi:HK97 family phage prohead protease
VTIDAPRDDLFRGLAEKPELRADQTDGDGSLMHGHFAVFDRWTEIDSWFEGRFLERLAPGAFKKTMREQRDGMRVQFDHGYDSFVGDSLLGPIDDLREDDEGAYYEVPLLDTDYNRDRILPMLQGRLISGEQRGSLLGASFRFRVVKDEWLNEPKKSDHNPEALPERTIKEVRLYEFGPVVFPAYAEATAGVRSLTDHYLQRRLAREGQAERAARHLAPAAQAPAAHTHEEPASGHSDGSTGGISVARALTDIERLRRPHREVPGAAASQAR